MPSGDKQIQDVYHRPNLERARKGRLPLVYFNHHSDNFINKHLVFVCRQRALYECVYINSIIINITYLVLSYIVFFI